MTFFCHHPGLHRDDIWTQGKTAQEAEDKMKMELKERFKKKWKEELENCENLTKKEALEESGSLHWVERDGKINWI